MCLRLILAALRRPRVALSILLLLFASQRTWGQYAAMAQQQEGTTLAESLKRADQGVELHLLYIHGIGINPPKNKTGTQDFEVSQEFRKSLCRQISCSADSPEGRDYADKHDFAPDAAPPSLKYLDNDELLWNNATEWRAAAPFVDHYKLVRTNGTAIYVDEINWWPLVMSAKCRQIIAKEAALVDRDRMHTETCSAQTEADQGGHFKSFAWITLTDLTPRKPPWPKAAAMNRWLKHDILDWGFSDALLAVGPLHKYLVEGIRELVLDSYNPAVKQEFVVVSHSLGSYLMFSALDLSNDSPAAPIPEWKTQFEKVLAETSHAYFMANQVRLLELANLDETQRGNLATHLAYWSELRARAGQCAPRIVAWSDPDDLLTWQVPDLNAAAAKDPRLENVVVQNLPAKNATRWFWLFANPEKAHVTYDQNKAVVRAMVRKGSAGAGVCPAN